MTEDQYPVPEMRMYDGSPQLAGYAGPPSYHTSHILELTDNTELLESFYLRLRGLEKNAWGEYVPSKYLRPLVNEHGSNQIMGLLLPVANRNTNLAGLEKAEIMPQLLELLDSLLTLLAMKRVEWEVESHADASAIANMFFNITRQSMSRAQIDGLNDKKFFGRITTEQTTRIESQQARGSGWMSRLNPWGGKSG